MTRFTVIPAQSKHCCQIWHRLRAEHRHAIDAVGANGHRELHNIFDQSSFARTMYADDRIIALGGIAGSILSPLGFAWIALAEEAKKYPLAITKEIRRQIDTAMVTKTEIATTIISGDEAAKRFAVFLGFHVADEGPGQPAHSRFGRRDLEQHLDSDLGLRVPMGRGWAINLGYHERTC